MNTLGSISPEPKWVTETLQKIQTGKGPVPNAYWVTPEFKNAGRMLAVIESVKFQFADLDKAPAEPDYSNLLDLNFPIYVQPGKRPASSALAPLEQSGHESQELPGRITFFTE